MEKKVYKVKVDGYCVLLGSAKNAISFDLYVDDIMIFYVGDENDHTLIKIDGQSGMDGLNIWNPIYHYNKSWGQKNDVLPPFAYGVHPEPKSDSYKGYLLEDITLVWNRDSKLKELLENE